MNVKSWFVLRIVAGLYVVYTGVKLISNVLAERPEHMTGMIMAGAAFAVIGTVIVIHSAREVYKLRKLDQSEAEEKETVLDSSVSQETDCPEIVKTVDTQEDEADLASTTEVINEEEK